MAQFDVFVNPIAPARSAYPYVVALQSNFAQDANNQIVAPLVPRGAMPAIAGRLTPVVSIGASEYVVLVPTMTGMRSRDLSKRHCSVAAAHAELLAAIDYLFFGV
jgi:toxin CcdB